jgi:hypothetical protein
LLGLASVQWQQKILASAVIILALLPIAALIFTNHLPAQKNLTLRRLDLALSILHDRNIPTDKILAAHPYILYQLHMPLDRPGDLRILNNSDLATLRPNTHLLLDAQLWKDEHRPPPAQLEAWGYTKDAEISEKTNQQKPTLPQLRYPGEVAEVELWIKQK